MHPPRASGAPVPFPWAAPINQIRLSAVRNSFAFFFNDFSPPEVVLMTVITMNSPGLVIKDKVGDHKVGVSAMQLSILWQQPQRFVTDAFITTYSRNL